MREHGIWFWYNNEKAQCTAKDRKDSDHIITLPVPSSLVWTEMPLVSGEKRSEDQTLWLKPSTTSAVENPRIRKGAPSLCFHEDIHILTFASYLDTLVIRPLNFQ